VPGSLCASGEEALEQRGRVQAFGRDREMRGGRPDRPGAYQEHSLIDSDRGVSSVLSNRERDK